MNTTQNRAAVLAQGIRASVAELRDVTEVGGVVFAARDNALASLEAIAEELETAAATPDPDGVGR